MNAVTSILAQSTRESSWAASYLAQRGFTLANRRSRRLTLSFVLDHVAIVYGLTRDELLQGRKHALTRQIAIFLARELTTDSTTQIGRTIKRDHSTVLYGYTCVRNRCADDPAYAAEIADTKTLIVDSFNAYCEALDAEQQQAS